MKKNNAFLVGWHAHSNTGDDAMLQVISWLLNKHFKVNKIKLLSTKKSLPKCYLPTIELDSSLYFNNNILFWNKLFVKKVAKLSDILVFGGGSIFHSFNSVNWKNNILRSFKKNNKNKLAMVLGVSFGPFSNEKAKKLCIDFLNNIDLVIVRDKESFMFVQENTKVKCLLQTYDLAFFMQRILNTNIEKKIHKKNKKVGISLKYFYNNDKLNNNLVDILTNIINTFSNEIEFVFFSFSKEDENFFSLFLNNKIEKKIYNDNPIHFMKEMAKCTSFIGMRLHSQIYSTILGLPLIILDYHKKCTNFASDLNIPNENIFNINNINNINIDLIINILNKNIKNEYIKNKDLEKSFLEMNSLLENFNKNKG
jgi:polysaccharide pyruvyl transferase WcaK-like protein